ncbi:hypothetical protein IV203_035913 [Nitzschia inconspicua]|uniref:Uncharacterized protein n=1 Tax=Nitzschia inconspicua TaxID=303405 RepID=A0A9K3LEA0_9STRA|nr:hypothetical protein IV203_006737 [Nitzschia inconspicua]KAG7360814.1 hypothetical protein IV203_035913 [Nitzschia inconspicua]
MSYLSPSEHRIWTRYMSTDKMRQYRRILETTPEMKRFSIHGGGDTGTVVDNDDDQILELATAIVLHQGGERSTLEEFTIEFFTVSVLSWNTLGNALRELPKLKRLFLRQVHVKNDDGETMPMLLTENLLSKCPTLEQLHMVDCHLNAMAAQDIARQLAMKHSRLQLLSLEGNSIGNVGVKCIGRVLEYNSSLLALDIDRVGCSMDAWVVLADSLKHNQSLLRLSCSGNGGLDPAVEKVALTSKSETTDTSSEIQSSLRHPFEEMICFNTTLLTIQPPRITLQIEFHLRLNRAGRKWIGDESMAKLFPRILHRVRQDPDVVFYFLKAQSGTMLQTACGGTTIKS